MSDGVAAGGQDMKQGRPLETLQDLHRAEADILEIIAREPRGGEMFLVDPLRFLREHGFAASAALEAELKKHLRVERLPSHLYDEVKAGRQSAVAGKESVRTTRAVRIHSLGIPAEVLK